jgi:hypothetical protein
LTGEERLIPKPAGVAADAEWDVESWFPDGAQLLAATYEPGGRQSVWTVSVLRQTKTQQVDLRGVQGAILPRFKTENARLRLLPAWIPIFLFSTFPMPVLKLHHCGAAAGRVRRRVAVTRDFGGLDERTTSRF